MSSLRAPAVEANCDGLVGPTHSFAGLAPGNLASEINKGGTCYEELEQAAFIRRQIADGRRATPAKDGAE